jgi:hypothetical protein
LYLKLFRENIGERDLVEKQGGERGVRDRMKEYWKRARSGEGRRIRLVSHVTTPSKATFLRER